MDSSISIFSLGMRILFKRCESVCVGMMKFSIFIGNENILLIILFDRSYGYFWSTLTTYPCTVCEWLDSFGLNNSAFSLVGISGWNEQSFIIFNLSD